MGTSIAVGVTFVCRCFLAFGEARKVRLLGLGALQAALSGNISQAVGFNKRQMVDVFKQLLGFLNALHLLNLYVPVYQNPNRPVLNSRGEHQLIYSGYFDENGNQVFYGYHWKVE